MCASAQVQENWFLSVFLSKLMQITVFSAKSVFELPFRSVVASKR